MRERPASHRRRAAFLRSAAALTAVVMTGSCALGDDPQPRQITAAEFTCDLWADTATGNDYGHDGSSAKPFATVYKLANSLGAGKTGCLRAGQAFGEPQGAPNWDKHINNPMFVQIKASGGPGSPITLRSGPGQTPASFTGQLEVVGSEDPGQPNAHDVVLRNISFRGSGTYGRTHLILNGDNVSLIENDITTPKGICVTAGMFQTYDEQWYAENGVQKLPDILASNLLIDRNRIHDCGHASTLQDLGESGVHGIYLTNTIGAKVTNNYIYSNKVRGVQMYPKSEGTLIANNVIDGNSSNVNIGGCWQNVRACTRKAISTNTIVENNIITNSTYEFIDDGYQIFANLDFNSPETYGNIVRNNCVWPDGPNNFGNKGAGGITYGYVGGPENNIVADPGYADRAGGDFSIAGGSPCAGKGPAADGQDPVDPVDPDPVDPDPVDPEPTDPVDPVDPTDPAGPDDPQVHEHPRGITLRLVHRSGRLIVKGGIFVDDGFFTCSQSQSVTITRNGVTIATPTTNDSYSAFKVRVADRPGRYRASVAPFDNGSDSCPAASASRRHRH